MLSALTSGAQSKLYQNPIVHTIITVIIFAIPMVLSHYSALDTLTVGGLLRLLSQWLETRTA